MKQLVFLVLFFALRGNPSSFAADKNIVTYCQDGDAKKTVVIMQNEQGEYQLTAKSTLLSLSGENFPYEFRVGTEKSFKFYKFPGSVVIKWSNRYESRECRHNVMAELDDSIWLEKKLEVTVPKYVNANCVQHGWHTISYKLKACPK